MEGILTKMGIEVKAVIWRGWGALGTMLWVRYESCGQHLAPSSSFVASGTSLGYEMRVTGLW